MIEQWLTDFLQYLKFEKRYAAHTLTAYSKDLQQFTAYIAGEFEITHPKAIKHFHIRSWLASLKDDKHTVSTINRKISSLSSFYKYLLRLSIVEQNPVKLLHALRKEERLPSYMKEEETDFLLHEIQFDEGFKGATDRLICDLLYQTGMRRSELIHLKEQDIEWSLKQIRVLGKGNKERLIPISEELSRSIRFYIEDKKAITCDTNGELLVLTSGKPLYAGYVYKIVQKYLGMSTTLSKKSPHILRHTFATHLLNKGANIQAIKELLGHSSLAATQVYTHNNIDKLKEIHKERHPRG
ncbi:MAG: tyrosine-type recombinase/integrase [Flavipsychrobacter sp.]